MSGTVKTNVFKLNQMYQLIVDGCIAYAVGTSEPSTLWAWGCADYGQLGDNNRINRSSPVQVPGTQWVQVSSRNGQQTLARKLDGTMWNWGRGDLGQLGDGQIFNRSSPVQVPGTQWSDVQGGGGVSFARKSDGTLWSFGYGRNGQLANNDGSATSCASSPIQIPGTQWCAVCTGYEHIMALKTDGTLWAWGINEYGQLGNNSPVSCKRSSPIQIPGTSWVEVIGGGFSGSKGHTLARKSDGTLWAWGHSNSGQLGDNTRTYRSSPVQVPGTQWTQVDAGGFHTAARKSDGTLWSWGYNVPGQLGDNTGTYRSSPVQVPGTNWVSVNAGVLHTAARKSDGTLWMWGYNDQGQLGINTVTRRSSPVQVPGTQWQYAQGTYDHTVARKSL